MTNCQNTQPIGIISTAGQNAALSLALCDKVYMYLNIIVFQYIKKAAFFLSDPQIVAASQV